MVKLENGGPAKKVPLTYYDEDGVRHVVGEAEVQLVDGKLQMTGHYDNEPGATLVGGINTGDFSVDTVGVAADNHVTRNNPSGSVQQCDRRDIHGPHEWQAEFGAYFDVYCPGNTGKNR